MKKEIANFFWTGVPLSSYERMCINSFIQNEFDVFVWSYSVLDIPAGAMLKDARQILSEDHLYKYTQRGEKGNLAAFSDVFRFTLVHKNPGEWWIDSDVICLKNQIEFSKLKESRDIVIGWEGYTPWVRNNSGKCNGAILSVPNEEVSNKMLIAQKHICDTVPDIQWGGIGPNLLTQFVKKYKLENQVLNESFFYPVFWESAMLFNDPAYYKIIMEATKNSHTCHLWNEVLRIHKFDKNELPEKDSYLHHIMEKYGNC
jgi:hypothetical protein